MKTLRQRIEEASRRTVKPGQQTTGAWLRERKERQEAARAKWQATMQARRNGGAA